MAEHLLNVEQVEVMGTGVIGAAMQDSGRRASEVVRRHVAQPGLSSPDAQDALHAARAGNGVTQET